MNCKVVPEPPFTISFLMYLNTQQDIPETANTANWTIGSKT